MPYSEQDVPDQSGRTILVTGANTGIGFEAAHVLALRNARVLLGCRSEDKALAAMDRIRESKADADLAWVPLDLTSLASIKSAAGLVRKESQLDVLINNAGVMLPPKSLTEDGFELQFGVNHLGHFALTAQLITKLLETPHSRVVNVSSLAHTSGRIDFDDVNAERFYDPMARYGMSKLANMLFTLALQKRLTERGADCFALGCHPGIADTELARYMPGWMSAFLPLMKPWLNTAAAGALPTLQAATSSDAKGNDYYGPMLRGETAGSSGRAYVALAARSETNAEKLWKLSEEMTGITFDVGEPDQ